MSEFQSLISQEIERSTQEKELLGELLRRHGATQDSVCAFQGEMARCPTFLFERSLAWIASNVRLAVEMPFMEKFKDEDGNIVPDDKSIDHLVQRPVDWSRQSTLAEYLICKPLHMFPPLLLVVTSPWVEDPHAPEWVEGRASRSSYEFRTFGSYSELGVLEMNQSQFQVFALDGQHRVIGIKGAITLAAGGPLYRLDKTGKPKGEPIQLEDWRKPGTNPAVDLPRETVGIKLIPAVIQGETREESRRRIAEVFVHVNQTSSPLKEGDLAQIDPSDGYSIVARKIATSHPFLKKEPGRSARVNFSNNTVALRSTVFTTLATVKRMARLYLESDEQFSTWRSKAQRAKSIATKPDQNEIELAQERVWDFWSAFAELPSLRKINPPISASTGEFRRLPTDSDPGAGHLLFRPVGQQILAEAVGRAMHTPGSDRTLEDIFDLLSKFDELGGFEIADPAQPWYGIVYSASMSRVLVAGQNLGADLLTYMLGGLADDIPQRLALRANFARARQSRDGFSFGFDGNEVPQDKLQLPVPLRKEA